MDALSLSAEEVSEKYDEIKNSYYENKKEEYEKEIRESDDDISTIREQVEDEIRASGQKDLMTDICIVPFIPGRPDLIGHEGGEIAESTDWEVKAIEPLRDLDVTSPDVVLANTQTGEACTIVCMPRDSTVGSALSRLMESTADLRENTVALKRQINVTVERDLIYPILVIPEKADNRARDEVEDIDDENGAEGGPYLLRVEMTDEERLGLITEIRTRTRRQTIPDGEMGEKLVDPIEVSREKHSLPNSYSFSHMIKKTSGFVRANVTAKVDSEPAKTHFSKEELTEYFHDQRNMSMSNGRDVVESLVEELLNWWLDVGLVEALSSSETKLDSSNSYRFNIDAQGYNPGKVIREIRDECEESLINEEIAILAKRRTLRDFDNEQPTLGDYS